MRGIVFLALLGALNACSGPPTVTYSIDAIKVDGQPYPCAIILDQQEQMDSDGEVLVTPAQLTVVYDDRREIRLGVRAMRRDSTNGKLTLLRAEEEQPYVDRERTLTFFDPPRQLFILLKNPMYLD